METRKAQVLFVDDEPNVLEMLRRVAHTQNDTWGGHFCGSADEALEVLATHEIDTVVTDVRMPGKDGFHLLESLRASERTKRIPVIVLTGLADSALKRKALDLGAADLLNKPVHREDLIARVRSAVRLKAYEDELSKRLDVLDQMVKERTQDLEYSRRQVLWRLAKAGEYRDDITGNHVVRVASYTCVLAEHLNMKSDFVELISLTSALHDIGKIGIPDNILLKQGPLTDEERAVIQRHTLIGADILSQEPKALAVWKSLMGEGARALDGFGHNPLLTMAAAIASGHHERWDGAGYPLGLARDSIPIEARLVAVADVYDALVSARPYKPAFPEGKALGILREEAGRQFDPEAVQALLARMDDVRRIGARLGEDLGS